MCIGLKQQYNFCGSLSNRPDRIIPIIINRNESLSYQTNQVESNQQIKRNGRKKRNESNQINTNTRNDYTTWVWLLWISYESSIGKAQKTRKHHFLPNNRGELFSTIFGYFRPFSTIFCHCLPGHLDDHHAKHVEINGCHFFLPDLYFSTWLLF